MINPVSSPQVHLVSTMASVLIPLAHLPATVLKDSPDRGVKPMSMSASLILVRTTAPVWTTRGPFAVSACQVSALFFYISQTRRQMTYNLFN